MFLDEALKILNSSFASASISALAGAALGAWGAGAATARAARKKELSDALRQANASLVLAMTAVNQIYSLKKQHVKPFVDEFNERRSSIERGRKTSNLASGDKVLTVHFNMMHLSPLNLPLVGLANLASSGQMMPGKALALVAMLEQTVKDHEDALVHRARVIEELRTSESSVEEKVCIYYGFPLPNGGSNLMFKSSIEAISLYTDDLAFFSLELVEILALHAQNVQKKLRKLDGSAPQAAKVDLAILKESGLVPPRADYESWLSGYVEGDRSKE